MQIPVHKANLIPRGKEVEGFILIDHYYYEHRWLEVWKQCFGPFYLHQTTIDLYALNLDKSQEEFIEDVRKTHTFLHSYLPCKCSLGKAFEKLEG